MTRVGVFVVPKEPRKALFDKHSSSDARGPRNRFGTFLKWVGGVTAFLSLIFALHQFIQLVADVRERQRDITELYNAGKLQQGAADYQAAWTSFEQAAKKADSGGQLAKLTGQLGEERRKLREAQEDLAMEWLQNVIRSKNQTFADVVDPLVPVLMRGVSSATGTRKADMLAHLGWSYFLRSRDGHARQDPEAQYRQALEIDSANPYAHVHWGHWKLWRGGTIEDGRQHFASAVASGRARPYVRRIELAALRNSGDNGKTETLRVVNDMIKNNEKIDVSSRSHLYAIYYFALNSEKDFRRLIDAVPATEQIAMIRVLFYDADFDRGKIPTREAYLAILQEAAGLRDEALKTWLAMRSGLSANTNLAVRADASIKRLSKK
jgi:hypothetical protein